MKDSNNMNRRVFLIKTGTAAAGLGLAGPAASIVTSDKQKAKKRIAIVGTGIRGTDMWGRDVVRSYGDNVELVGLCDINPGRVQYAKEYIGINCPTFTDFEKMVQETKPETIIVTTVDATHNEFITKGLEMNCDIITEKPMTTDETKCQAILDSERKSGKKVTVTFNYRYSPHRQKIKELLMEKRIGEVTSSDFHWYLDTSHGADYFRRWHGQREKSGTLLVHKASYHFDLLNWWLDSEPQEIFAYGNLEFYGKNNSFRSEKCRGCEHKSKCRFFFDMTKNERLMKLYADNEKYDNYFRDGCLWRNSINIFDKMAVQIKYANNVQVSYSLTTYSPYEGYRIAFNGTKGRLEAWIQERQPWPMEDYDQLRVTENFGKTELINIPHSEGGHGGGDTRMKDKIFKNPDEQDTYVQAAGTRDGAMAILLGIAARNSIDTGKPVKIADLTDLKPQAKRPA